MFSGLLMALIMVLLGYLIVFIVSKMEPIEISIEEGSRYLSEKIMDRWLKILNKVDDLMVHSYDCVDKIVLWSFILTLIGCIYMVIYHGI